MLKTIYFISHLSISILLGILLSCQQKNTEKVADKNDKDTKNIIQTITITPAQAKAIGLEVGNFEKRWIGQSVKANGVVDVPPNAKALVCSQVEGFVKYLDILNGQYVQKGQLLTELEHFSYIQMQENYLTLCSEYRFLEQELTRQQTLAQDNVNALKTLQKVQSDMESVKAKKASLEKQLQILGFTPSQIQAHNLRSTIPIYAPIQGYVKAVHINLGKSIAPNTPMFEIVNTEHKHLELQVFEKDILKIKEKQKITFQIPTLGNTDYEAEVYLIEKSFNPQTKTIGIHAHFDKEKEEKFMEGMFVNAKIWIEQAEAEVVPEESLIKDGEMYYIFAEQKPNTFVKIAVKVENISNQFAQINCIDTLPVGRRIVKKGAYYLQAQLNQKEED